MSGPGKSSATLPLPEALKRALGVFQTGDLEGAERLCKSVLAAKPDSFDALHLSGLIAARRGDFGQSERLIGAALRVNPQSAPAYLNRGNALVALKRWDEALASYERALAVQPNYAEAEYNRGNVLAELGRTEQALAGYGRALALKPDHAQALRRRGLALMGLGRPEQALESYDRALAHSPDFAEALHDRGNALKTLDRAEEALASYDRALILRPDHAETLNNRGVVLKSLKRMDEALASYDRALKVRPDFAEALGNRANVLVDMGRFEEALPFYGRALALAPGDAQMLNNRGQTYASLGAQAEAAADFARTLELDPDYPYARGALLHARMNRCDWTGYERDLQLVEQAVQADKPASLPFVFMTLSSSAETQLRCARIAVRDKCPESPASLWRGERYSHGKIRVAYVSADFRDHPVGHAIGRLAARHDRARFETTAVSIGPDAAGETRARFKAAFNRFIDVRETRDEREVAKLLREMEIDIAVDLTGFTTHCRPAIFAQRPAPVQVSYTGYSGTMGAGYIDYIMADRTVIPPEQRGYYAEKAVYLPDTYLANGAPRPEAARAPTRSEMGLPESGFVFCAFNNAFKITPPIFDVWMRLLVKVPGSVLWLSAGGDARDNLRREAARRGMAPERLAFSTRIGFAEHIARHRLAGLFLDTLPYNAHSTAVDALWAGLPVVTCLGTTFVGRVAASLLGVSGLPELVANSLVEYETLALRLATDPAALAAAAQKLARGRAQNPLFDTNRLCRHIETAYATMWERQQRGEKPESFAVQPAA